MIGFKLLRAFGAHTVACSTFKVGVYILLRVWGFRVCGLKGPFQGTMGSWAFGFGVAGGTPVVHLSSFFFFFNLGCTLKIPRI